MPTRLVDKAPLYMINRPFEAAGINRERGEVVDCAEWRNVQPLINGRMIVPIYDVTQHQMVSTPDGRQWIDQETADRHLVQAASERERIAEERRASRKARSAA